MFFSGSSQARVKILRHVDVLFSIFKISKYTSDQSTKKSVLARSFRMRSERVDTKLRLPLCISNTGNALQIYPRNP